jgi:aquaporin related protein
LNFFGCAACTHAKGDETLIALAFGLAVFMAVMVSDLIKINTTIS